MTYIYGLEKSPDNITDYLDRVFKRGVYSVAAAAPRCELYHSVNSALTDTLTNPDNCPAPL